MAAPKTLFDKIWDSHVITDLGNGFVLLHIDRLLLHDLSGARALREVIDKGYTPAQPRLVYATPDHAISTMPGEQFKFGARVETGCVVVVMPRETWTPEDFSPMPQR